MHSLIERFRRIFGLGILVLLFAGCGGGGGGFSDKPGQEQATTTLAEPLSITTDSLDDGAVGQTYLQLLEVEGGSSDTEVQWVSEGQLPPGLTLDSSLGTINGTPTAPGAYPFLVQAQDTQNSGLNSAIAQFSITIAAAAGSDAYSPEHHDEIAFTGWHCESILSNLADRSGWRVQSDFKWSVTSGQLPLGLQLTKVSATQSKIEGTPTQGGTFTFLIKLEDIANPGLTPAIQQFNLTIQGGSTSGNTSAAMSLSTSSVSVPSNSSTGATITATVLDANKAVIPGANVNFSADGGQLNPGSAVTDKNGNAVTEFRAGGTNANQVTTITATAGALSKQIPIRIVGTTLQLTPSATSLPDDGSQESIIETKLLNSGNVGIFNSPVCFQTQSSNGGNLIFLDMAGNTLNTPCPVSNNTGVFVGNTDVDGQLRIRAKGSNAGNLTLRAVSAGSQASVDFSITSIAQLFQIIAPPSTVPPQIINTGEFTFTVKAPGTTTVVLSTSLGVWQNGQASIEVPVVGNQATAKLTSSIAGTANVVARDKANPTRTDNRLVQFTADITNANKVILDASSRVVPVSVSGVQNTSTLIAQVLTDKNEPVANAVVSFSLKESTGGGEIINPPTAVTDTTGVARTTFISGARASSQQGIKIQARVVKPNGSSLTAEISIIITDKAGSVTIGRSTTVESINENTAYRLPMSVLVADINNNPVKNSVVNLSTWPTYYSTGFRLSKPPTVIITGTFPNEDINEDAICQGCVPPGSGEDINGDGTLTPPNSAAGNLPRTVTTDDNGLATFNLVYLKENADWIVDRVRASTEVSGTQIVSQIEFRLSGSASDETADPPVLPPSPFNSVCPYFATSYVDSMPSSEVKVQPGKTATVDLTLYPFANAPQADVADQPVRAFVTGTAITASGGYTNFRGNFTSTIGAGAATVGTISTVSYYVGCAQVDITVTVVQ